MDKLLEKLNINKKAIKYTKQLPKIKANEFENIKTIVPPKEHYNYQMDYLELPKTKKQFNRLLVIVDLATNKLDFEPTKNKSSETTLKAMKKIFDRGILPMPYASIRTDGGAEFKGPVKNYLYEESILHSIGLTARHKQQANVESANRQLGKLLNAYMNTKEFDTGKVYREWTDIIDILREELNKLRYKKPKNKPISITTNKPKYEVGDLVYRKLETPLNALGQKQYGKFREGDIRIELTPREIVQVLYYPKSIRYMLSGIKNASYHEKELTK
jgi:hypothetical protein